MLAPTSRRMEHRSRAVSQSVMEEAPEGARLSVARADELVMELVSEHADSLLRVAHRYSLCADDAHDAYQRGMEILLRHARRLDPDRASGWIRTVVKHEAMAINRQRRRIVGSDEVDLDALEASEAAPHPRSTPVGRARGPLRPRRCQPQAAGGARDVAARAGALVRADRDVDGVDVHQGQSLPGRGTQELPRALRGDRGGGGVRPLAPALSAFVDGEADARTVIEVRNHLRGCGGCRAVVRGLHDTAQPLSIVLPAATLATAASASPPGAGFFSRVYESLAMTANERAANAVLRAQAVVDTVATGKMAVAAASVAAVAGGGAAVNGAMRADERPTAIIQRAQAQALTTRPIADKTPVHRTRKKARRVVRARHHATVHHAAPARRQAQAQPQPQVASAPAPQTTASAPATASPAGREDRQRRLRWRRLGGRRVRVRGALGRRCRAPSQPEDQVADGGGLGEERVVAGVEFHDAGCSTGELALPVGRGALVLRADEVRRGHVLPGR